MFQSCFWKYKRWAEKQNWFRKKCCQSGQTRLIPGITKALLGIDTGRKQRHGSTLGMITILAIEGGAIERSSDGATEQDHNSSFSRQFETLTRATCIIPQPVLALKGSWRSKRRYPLEVSQRSVLKFRAPLSHFLHVTFISSRRNMGSVFSWAFACETFGQTVSS